MLGAFAGASSAATVDLCGLVAAALSYKYTSNEVAGENAADEPRK